MRFVGHTIMLLGILSCSEESLSEVKQPLTVRTKYVFELRGPRAVFEDHSVRIDGKVLTGRDLASEPDQVLFRAEFPAGRVEDLPSDARELQIESVSGTATVVEPLRANKCIGYPGLTSEAHQYELVFGEDRAPLVRLGCYDCVAGEYGSLTCRQYAN